MWKKILSLSLVMVMLLSFTACAKEPTAQEIVNGVVEAWDDQRTGQVDMDMTIDMVGEAEGEAFEANMVINSKSIVDLENRQMRTDMTMSVAVTGENETEVEMEMYLIGDMVYMGMEVPEMGPMWMKSEMPEGYWKEMSQTEAQVELLKTATVEVVGSEKVGGVNCYVLKLTPDIEQLWQLVMQQTEVTGQEMPDITEEFLQEVFRNFSVKQWVAKDTHFLTKAEVEMALELTPEAMGLPEEEGAVTMDMSITLLAYNYNKPVSIVLPPEAEEAIEIPMSGESTDMDETETELSNVQAAVTAMMVDNEVWELSNPVTVATNDMSRFPDANGTHILYGLSKDNQTINYIATRYTTGTYTVDKYGTVTQVTTGFE